MPIIYDQEARCFHLTNGRVSYVIRLAAGKYPLHLYWGRALRAVTDDLVGAMTTYTEDNLSLHETPLDRLPQECPTGGMADLREGMLDVRLADGARALCLTYCGHDVTPGKPEIPGLPSARGEGASTLTLRLKDEYSGLEVELRYTVYEDVDVITRSMRVVNATGERVTLLRALSACVDFQTSEHELLTFSGAWARERAMVRRPLVPGHQGVGSTHGASGHQAAPMFAMLEPGAGEETGEVYGFALCYSGSFTAGVTVDQYGMARAQLGIQPSGFAWTLEPGEQFDTPEACLCYSAQGLGGMSRAMHAFIHAHVTSGKYARSRRPILINNWEATYFDFNEEKLVAMAECAKGLGIDLFVLDDGWFGHRDVDNCSLGDWHDDRRKLPDGLAGLSARIHALGMQFGLWVEPEMISPDSDLYRAHPDWCIHAGGRMRVEARSQLVLDLSRQDVRDHIVESICAALERGHVDYVKWDMNRNINMWGSAQLPPERWGELAHRYILGVYDIMGRITSRFPDVLFESCAGGGGRFDLGMMCLMPQAWCSDDTDAHERCKIQYATSIFFPASCMGAHVSAVPNHQTGRITPLATRAAVAMAGTYGYELDVQKLSEEEHAQIRALNERVHAMQELLLYGQMYRLRSPYEGNETAWMTVAQDRGEALVTYVQALARPNAAPGLLRLAGLDPQRDYRDEATGRVYGGDELMHYGYRIVEPRGEVVSAKHDFQSWQIHLVAVK